MKRIILVCAVLIPMLAAAQDVDGDSGASQDDALASLGEEIGSLAAEGDAAAQTLVGTMYRFGYTGEGSDPAKAAEWYRKAAD